MAMYKYSMWTSESGGCPRKRGMLLTVVFSPYSSFIVLSTPQLPLTKMPSDSLLAPRFPSLTQDTLFSFYTRPVVRRHKTDQSLLNPRSPYLKANKPSTAKNTIILSASPSGTAQTHGELLVDHLKRKEGDLIAASPILSSADDAGPWPAESSASVKAAQKKAVERVQLRALMTKLPAGAALSADEHRLNMTEMNWLDEWASLVPKSSCRLYPIADRCHHRTRSRNLAIDSCFLTVVGKHSSSSTPWPWRM